MRIAAAFRVELRAGRNCETRVARHQNISIHSGNVRVTYARNVTFRNAADIIHYSILIFFFPSPPVAERAAPSPSERPAFRLEVRQEQITGPAAIAL